MDSSRRAVESYWRSRMIDEATSNEDKVTPVYKLEEICELLRSSDVGIVKELSGFVLKRLEHKSPVVKQKALRLIKYCVGKSGVEFQREMQRHSVVIRQLIHHKGQSDPLKGDALNKAVRETAQEALSSLFSEVENKPAPAKTLDKRIEGFGNANFQSPSEEKKSFFSEVVNMGSASIKQGLSSLAQSHSMGKNDSGSYQGPNLHRSLTMEREDSSGYEPVRLHGEARSNISSSSNDVSSGSSNYSFRAPRTDSVNGDSGSTTYMGKTREDKLLETIVTFGGVRLQPTRDALQVFLAEALKLDGLALSRALELKLQSPHWQIRMKALCVLDYILRRRGDEPFSIISSYFAENFDVLVKCNESPQASLRDKAVKVLRLLKVEENSNEEADAEKPKKAEIQMPDLIDTGSDLSGEIDGYPGNTKESDAGNISTHGGTLVDDLFGDGTTNESRSHLNNDDDPFSNISFYTDQASSQVDDLFAGMSLSDKDKNVDPFPTPTTERNASNVDDLLAGFTINGSESESKQNVGGENISTQMPIAEHYPPQHAYNDALSSMLGSQMPAAAPGFGTVPAGVPHAPLFNFQPQQPLNFGPGAMNNLLLQQQYLAMMSNLQQFSYLNPQTVDGTKVPSDTGSSTSAPFPDIFQTNFVAQPPTSVMSNSRREDTKAFDFISDHLATARDTKRFL